MVVFLFKSKQSWRKVISKCSTHIVLDLKHLLNQCKNNHVYIWGLRSIILMAALSLGQQAVFFFT